MIAITFGTRRIALFGILILMFLSQLREIEEYSEPGSDTFKEYMHKWKQVAESSPALSYILPIVEALARSEKPALPSDEGGLLRRPLQRVGMRCAKPGCDAHEAVRVPFCVSWAVICHTLPRSLPIAAPSDAVRW